MTLHAPRFAIYLFALCFNFSALAQTAEELEKVEKVSAPSAPLTALEKKQEALVRIVIRQKSLSQEMEKARTLLRSTKTSDFEKGDAAEELQKYKDEYQALSLEFSKVSTGIDFEALARQEQEKINLRDELTLFLDPVFQEFRDATAAPRESEELKSQINDIQRKLKAIENAEAALKEVQSEENGPMVTTALKEEETQLEKTRQELETQLSVADYQLAELQKNSPSFLESLSDLIQNFFRTRGAHLLLAILISGGLVLLIRLGYRTLIKFSPKKVRRGDSFTGRLIHLCYILLAILGGLLGFILSLYLANDWVLLAITLLFLLGIAWAGKHTIPQFFEQGKMMLNLGTVRYGERIIFEGIPWEVQRINFYTDLVNPSLEGGLIRLPIKVLMPLHSRPTGENEIWFPSRNNDWIRLNDGTFGKVVQQTPDHVHLVKLGGTRKVIPTAEFLSMHPENLSMNFRIEVTFGIDYEFQSIATDQVPEIFKAAVQRALIEEFGKKMLHSIKVHFTYAGASSLDYRIVADFNGEIASRKNVLEDRIQSACVDVCNEQDWGIPFQQITIHQTE